MTLVAYPPPPAENAAGARMAVLVVDDQPDNLLSAEAVLESLGEEVVTAESGAEALLRVLDRDFAVIVLDIMMPGMDGFETAEMIRSRERSRHTPIIFLTALGRNPEHILRGYNTGAVDYIVKPFVPEILRAKVAAFVDMARKSAQLEARNRELRMTIERLRAAEAENLALNRRLEQQVSELAEMNRDLERFSFSVSQDLRTPLSRIAGFSKALAEAWGDRLDETGRHYLERMERSSTAMCDLVDDLLAFSRAARLRMDRRMVNLSELAEGIAAELAARHPGRNVEFAIAPGLSASGDPGLLRTALLNLLENAWKYTAGHATARIEFGAQEQQRVTVYFVRDDGAGFDMESAGRLFIPFERLQHPSEFEGSGIGLATVARIVARHGGRIWAQSEVERGATFFFTLQPAEEL